MRAEAGRQLLFSAAGVWLAGFLVLLYNEYHRRLSSADSIDEYGCWVNWRERCAGSSILQASVWAVMLYAAPLALGIISLAFLSDDVSPDGPLTAAWVVQCARLSSRSKLFLPRVPAALSCRVFIAFPTKHTLSLSVPATAALSSASSAAARR